MKRYFFLIIGSLLFESKIMGQLLLNPTQPNATERFFFYGSTSLNTSDELVKSITGTQKFLAKVVLDPMTTPAAFPDNSDMGLDIVVGVNALNLKPSSVAKDSIDLVSLMFPETGNFGFMVAPIWHYFNYHESANSVHRLSAEVTFCLRQNKVDILTVDSVQGASTTGINFTVLNYNIAPIKYSYQYRTNDFRGEFSVTPYFHLFNIPNEDANEFNKLFPKDKPIFIKPTKSNIQAVGCKFTVSLNDFFFFMDVRNNFTEHANLADQNPFKGFVFNAGFASNIEIFRK